MRLRAPHVSIDRRYKRQSLDYSCIGSTVINNTNHIQLHDGDDGGLKKWYRHGTPTDTDFDNDNSDDSYDSDNDNNEDNKHTHLVEKLYNTLFTERKASGFTGLTSLEKYVHTKGLVICKKCSKKMTRLRPHNCLNNMTLSDLQTSWPRLHSKCFCIFGCTGS